MSSTSHSDIVFEGGGRRRTLTVRRHPRARRMRLSVDPRDGAVTLSLPRRGALAAALDWVEQKRPWVEQALAALPRSHALAPGGSLPWEGRERRIMWQGGGPRTPVLLEDRIEVGGPAEAVAPRLLRWARGQALVVLDHETRALAARAGVTIAGVGVGDPRSRWASCSATGRIRYSWRLMLAPPFVRQATVAHEVAHRVHMNHSPAFHALAADLTGFDPAAARQWLRAHGAALHAVGRVDS